jgi:hypothetical protein
MNAAKLANLISLTSLAAVASPAFAQGVPLSSEATSCNRGNTGNLDSSGATIPYPSSINCGPGSLAGGEGATAV